MSRPRWFVQLIKMAYPGRFLAARATRLPILGDIVEHWVFDEDHLVFLPQDRVVQVDEAIELPGEMVLPSQVVEHCINEATTHWIMDFCLCRDGDKLTRMPGVTVSVNGNCVGCGTCTQSVCFADAIHLVGDRAVINEACRGCGRCIDVCPQNAIEITIEDGQFVQEAIDRVSPLVNVS